MGRSLWHFDTILVYQDWDPDNPDSHYIFLKHEQKGLEISFTWAEAQSLEIQPGEPAALALLTGDDLDLLESQ